MKIQYLTFAILWFIAACSEKPATAEAMNLQGFEITSLPGSDMQQASLKDAKGKLLESGTILNGKKHGEWVVYQKEKDLPLKVANYVDGVLNGPYFEFAPYGQVSLVSNYRNNLLHGHFVKYKSIRKEEEGYYLEGQLDGIFKKYFDGQDKVQQEIAFKQGKQHGEHLFYNEKGEVSMRYTYENGEKLSGGIVQK
ncbi:MAG: hypothetical protein MUC59_19600 [Saprospiraceae bacterium]|jgi:antitoxin component YwqK of YwqJK toxin-antitoxin module|nr:hypothetical protein [Saprospiraceae bacterium]